MASEYLQSVGDVFVFSDTFLMSIPEHRLLPTYFEKA